MDGRTNLLMHRKVVGVVFFGVVAAFTSPTTAGRSVVQGSGAVAVVVVAALAVVLVVVVVVVVLFCSGSGSRSGSGSGSGSGRGSSGRGSSGDWNMMVPIVYCCIYCPLASENNNNPTTRRPSLLGVITSKGT